MLLNFHLVICGLAMRVFQVWPLLVSLLLLCAAATELEEYNAKRVKVKDALGDMPVKEQLLHQEGSDVQAANVTSLASTQSAFTALNNAFNVGLLKNNLMLHLI